MPEAVIHETRVEAAWSPTASTRAVRLARPEGFVFEATHAVRLFLDGPAGETSRSLSIASGPERPGLDLAVRRSPSDFKRAFLALRPGDPVRIRGPKGRFLLERDRPAVLVAGGIGITPFRCMLQSLAVVGARHPVRLIYANHDPSDLPFADELDDLAAGTDGVEIWHTVSEVGAGQAWTGRVGRVDRALLEEAAQDLEGPAWYLAGPPIFVRALVDLLGGLDVPQDRLHAEVFKGYEDRLVAEAAGAPPAGP